MHSEYWSWSPEMRDAHLWLIEGKLVMAWGRFGNASHLLSLRNLEDAIGKSDAVIAVVGEDDDGQEIYRLWADGALDVVIVSHRAYLGIFLPADCGVRREYYTGVGIETPGGSWWVSDQYGVTTVVSEWRDVLSLLAGEPEEE